jgi:hypothetical protein
VVEVGEVGAQQQLRAPGSSGSRSCESRRFSLQARGKKFSNLRAGNSVQLW